LQADDGIRDFHVTGVQTCALPIWYVARPFLYTGMWYGLAGGLLAWIALTVVLWALSTPVQELLALYESQHQLRGLGLAGTALLLGGSGLLGWLGAFISVRQHLAKIEPT